MEIQFQHANPHSGRESVLLRIDGLLADQTVCVLVDAGANVSTADLLDEGENEYLSAICVTHAHLDHYRSLGEALDHAAPVYAATETARILEDVFAVGAEHYDLSGTDRVLEQVEPIDAWTQIVPGLRVKPIPAGHAPGAAAFLFEIVDGDERRTILATGDFTLRRAAGYPGFDPEIPVDVDVLVLAAATSDAFEPTLTDAVATIHDRARAGSTVLATASGLTGVHVAYLLGHLADRRDERLPITLAGHVATLFDRLDYAVPNVETVPDFADPSSLLTRGGVTIAGPEVPVDGSAERLYEAIADDPGATLVQLPSGGTEPVAGATCTTHQFSLSNHPSPGTIDDVVETLSPVHVVVAHQQGAAAARYKDKYDSFVWATDDARSYTLRDETGWTPPPWVTEPTVRRVLGGTSATGLQFDDALPDIEGSIPSVTRADDVDLEAEGLELDRLSDRLRADPDGQPPNGSRDEQLEPGGSRDESPELEGSRAESSEPEATRDESPADIDRQAPSAERQAAERTCESPTDERPIESTLATIDARLEQIEAAVSDRVVDARVVDAGDGTILLRLEDPPAHLEHGRRLRVRLSGDRLASSDQQDRAGSGPRSNHG